MDGRDRTVPDVLTTTGAPEGGTGAGAAARAVRTAAREAVKAPDAAAAVPGTKARRAAFAEAQTGPVLATTARATVGAVSVRVAVARTSRATARRVRR